MGCDIHLMLEYRVKPECIPSDINDFKYNNLRDAIDKFDRGEITEDELNEAKKKMVKLFNNVLEKRMV